MFVDLRPSKEIGTFVLFLGIFFLFLGVFLLFDKKLLAMGNFLFIFGFAMLSGARRTLEFFGLAGDRDGRTVEDRDGEFRHFRWRYCACVLRVDYDWYGR